MLCVRSAVLAPWWVRGERAIHAGAPFSGLPFFNAKYKQLKPSSSFNARMVLAAPPATAHRKPPLRARNKSRKSQGHARESGAVAGEGRGMAVIVRNSKKTAGMHEYFRAQARRGTPPGRVARPPTMAPGQLRNRVDFDSHHWGQGHLAQIRSIGEKSRTGVAIPSLDLARAMVVGFE